jgi:hypothetical protein
VALPFLIKINSKCKDTAKSLEFEDLK